jgi:hypothetical protein
MPNACASCLSSTCKINTGLIDVGTFLERLQNSAAAHSVHLRRLQDDAARAQEAQMLRQEQDREYDEAMRADQMRVRKSQLQPQRDCKLKFVLHTRSIGHKYSVF